jgi:hypothetical protein
MVLAVEAPSLAADWNLSCLMLPSDVLSPDRPRRPQASIDDVRTPGGKAALGWTNIGLLTVLTVFLWRLTLSANKTLVHGDSIIFGLPLFDLRARFASGHGSALWSDMIFGGYPLLGESQAGFLSPLPMLLATIVTPLAGTVFTANLFRPVCMVLGGIGVLGLARSLGLSRWSALFAALAVIFSPLWLYCQTNPALGSTYLYVPWCLWAMEIWLKRPNLRTAAVMGVAMAGGILAGYPQASHGTAAYMALTLLPAPFSAVARGAWAGTWRVRLATGAFAAVLCVGLSAVLLLPLFELVGQSHRSGGVPLQFQVTPKFYLRGMFYTLTGDVRASLALPANGSLIVCVLASLALLFDRSWRIVGHFLAAVVMMQLGFGEASPFFRIVYDHDLLPGMHYFRNTALYLIQWTVGAAVLAGATIDGLTRWTTARDAESRPLWRSLTVWGVAAIALLWGWMLERVHTPDARLLQFAILGASFLGFVALARARRAHSIPALFAALMIIEVASLRLDPFHVASDALLAEPGSVHAIKALPDWRDFRVIDASAAPAYAFQDSRSPSVNQGLRRMLSAMSGLTPVLWDLRGMDGAFALPLARLIEARTLFYAEIDGRADRLPGARLIDLLSIRFISVDLPAPAPAIRPFWHEEGSVYVMENTAAKPRFQTYARHVSVGSFDDAVSALRSLRAPALVIENPPGPSHQPEPADTGPEPLPGEAPPIAFEVRTAEATSYQFDVQAAQPGWLFVADANYPGWGATIDGQITPVFTAQLLGKAVSIPAGHHQVSLSYKPLSVRVGASISLLAAAIAAIALIFGPKMSSWTRTRGGTRR